MRVLDLGGTPAYWASAPVQPASVTVVNLAAFPETVDHVSAVVADACSPPETVTRNPYDLVVSNSLLEHVGGHVRRQQLSDAIRGAADRHFVQTPYRYFPVEPHWLFPGLQFLPFAARVWVTRTWPLGHRHAKDLSTAVASVNEVDLVGLRQMRSYFPESDIVLERFLGVPKSLIAVRS